MQTSKPLLALALVAGLLPARAFGQDSPAANLGLALASWLRCVSNASNILYPGQSASDAVASALDRCADREATVRKWLVAIPGAIFLLDPSSFIEAWRAEMANSFVSKLTHPEREATGTRDHAIKAVISPRPRQGRA